jgi:serine/threonine protein kinase
VEDQDKYRDVLKDLILHDNIVNFYHMENDVLYYDSDGDELSEDGVEDPTYRLHLPVGSYIPKFSDIRTLEELIRQQSKPSGLPTSKAHSGLHEPFVWHTLTSLLRAAKYLHTGLEGHPSRSPSPQDWMPVIHNDIRPANIIFTHPLAKKSAYLPFRYGGCKLGNFNRCLLLSSAADIGSDIVEEVTPDDQEVIEDRREQFAPLYYKGEQTGYEAPEIVGDDNEANEYPAAWSDIWSIGAVAIAMMTGRMIWDLVLEQEFEDNVQANDGSAQIEDRWRHASMHRRHTLLRRMAGSLGIVRALPDLYSEDLRYLVESLLAFNPWERGETAYVLDDVERKYIAWRAKGCRDFERDAVHRREDEESDRGMLLAIKDAQNYIAGFDERVQAHLRDGEADSDEDAV